MECAITEEVRVDFIRKSEKEIETRRKNSDWEHEFQIAKRQFKEAVTKYHKCK